jgi:hypothetical protein
MSIMGGSTLFLLSMLLVFKGGGRAEFGLHEPEAAGKGTCRLAGTTLIRVRAL